MSEAGMKLMVRVMRFLSLCAVVLLLPAITTAQCVSQLTVQRVFTQDASGAEKTIFAPREVLVYAAELNNSYGEHMLKANGTQFVVIFDYAVYTIPVDIPPGISTLTGGVFAPSTEGSYTVRISVYDHFCDVWVEGRTSFTISQSPSPPSQLTPGWYSHSRPSIIYEDEEIRMSWEKSYIYPYTGESPLYWYTEVVYFNKGNQTHYIDCFGQDELPPVRVYMRGTADSGYVDSEETICSRDPDFTITLKPGESFYNWMIFPEMPGPGDEVSLEWEPYGSSEWVDLWHAPFDALAPAECPEELVTLGVCQPGTQSVENTSFAGYAVTGTRAHPIVYKNVVATWKVPEVVSCANQEHSQAATWAGFIDSLDNPTSLVQVATVSSCNPISTTFQKNYHAAWQVYNKGQTEGQQRIYSLPIFPGNEVRVELKSYGFGEFGIDIWNLTLGLHWKQVVSGDNSPTATATAVCLQELPEGIAKLAHFSSVTITCIANNLPIGSAGDIILKVVSPKMKTGDLSTSGKGDTFTVDWISP